MRSRDVDQQRVERRLSIGRVRAQVAEIPARIP
jgi:hypothetical protein